MSMLEKDFLHGADEPGMIFFQKMIFNYESQITDRNEYMPSGSVLPGYRTKNRDFMDDEYHAAPDVFEFVASENADRYADMFAVSTVRPSEIALGGGYHTSYSNENTLTDAEANEKDSCYSGDQLNFIDLSQEENM